MKSSISHSDLNQRYAVNERNKNTIKSTKLLIKLADRKEENNFHVSKTSSGGIIAASRTIKNVPDIIIILIIYLLGDEEDMAKNDRR
jgi:predicted fused transcriptional regulator/phosphomethylpyrimidine kinase